MRENASSEKILAFLPALAARVHGPGRIFLVGGATAVLKGWRASTIDIDIKAEPEPAGFFEAIAELKDSLSVNVELASPDQFLPELPGWRERSLFITRIGQIDFFHYDPYAQALAKIERGHPRDIEDAAAFRASGLVLPALLRDLFAQIQPELIRFPAIDSASFSERVESWCRL